MSEIKKIPWIKRIFWSWKKLCDYFSNSQEQNTIKNVLKEKNESLENKIDELNQSIGKWKQKYQDVENQLILSKNKINDLQQDISKKDGQNNELLKNITKLETKQHDLDKTNKELWNKISNQLKPLERIETTFFGSSGNKGIGELGEMQLKTWLDKFGVDRNVWIENLQIEDASGIGQVEFAMRSSFENDKWIPVDSKVIQAKRDENNDVDIEDYAKKVKDRAKEIHDKYLGKKNTTNYGILVMHSNEIYDKFVSKKAEIVTAISQSQNVMIISPTLFIQCALLLSYWLGLYKNIEKAANLCNDINDLMRSIRYFNEQIEGIKDSFRIAYDKHYKHIDEKYKLINANYPNLIGENKKNKANIVNKLEISKK